MEQNENTLSVLKIAPGQYPQQVEIDNNLKALQEAVGGTIAAVYPFADPVAIICNDDGKLMGLPLNRALRDENGEMYDAVAGTFLVVGLGEEDFVSLSPELAQKYEQLFHQPEAFLKLGKTMEFFNSAIEVLQTLVVALGAGLGVWGAINLLEGYGNDNPGSKSQGMKQFMAN